MLAKRQTKSSAKTILRDAKHLEDKRCIWRNLWCHALENIVRHVQPYTVMIHISQTHNIGNIKRASAQAFLAISKLWLDGDLGYLTC
eukprot:4547296-Amphidinium_carterae.1